ncbi:MAG: cobalt-precorrin 5A hydrolase [Roseburia sp.]
MKLCIISFTKNGMRLSEKVAEEIKRADVTIPSQQIETALFTKCKECMETEKEGISFAEKSIGEWTKEQMKKRNALLFIGACGIAVRAIAPNIADKLHDSPVLVMDERGKYVIPILSGHIGGANELAVFIAKKTGAEPVITTATDINGAFAVDVFAKKNRLFVVNKDGIAKVSSKVLSGQTITLSIESGHYAKDCRLPKGIQLVEYPPMRQVDLVISSEKREFEAMLLLRPMEYVIGMGCKRGKPEEKIEGFIREHLEKFGILPDQVAGLASIDVKKDERGLLAWSRKEKIPFVTYTAEELSRVNGDFRRSDFVKEKVGVDNVCERAALKMCEPEGQLVYQKCAKDGMTIAIARREWSVNFDEE